MTKDELLTWKRSHVTQEVLAHIVAKRMDLEEIVLHPSIIHKSNMALVLAQTTGYKQAVQDVIDFQLEEENEDA